MKKLNLLIIFLLTLLPVSCSPKLYQTQETFHKDTLIIYKVRIDSVYRRDSIFIKEKADTVFVYKEKIYEHYSLLRDTTFISKVDTIRVNDIQYMEKALSKWQSFQMVAGDIFMVVVGILLLFAIFKLVKKFIL